jgi:murein DD-endopeptidase MepM/ murein hydrolase activator NlpD
VTIRSGIVLGLVALGLVAFATGATAVELSWTPERPRPGDAVRLFVRGAGPSAEVQGIVAGRPVRFFPTADGHAGLVGIDVDDAPGRHPWQLTVRTGGTTQSVEGELTVGLREFRVQHLTLPPAMVELDPPTERRALAEAERLKALYLAVTPERLWRGVFARPVAGAETGTGFGARRVINGKPRAPHTGLDYAAPTGSPVHAANAARVALVGDFFFPGRLIVLDHGLGLYSLYFHLDRIAVDEGVTVSRGQMIGTVGATGRATGPHLHFGISVGGARIDPDTLLGLPSTD